MEFGMIAWYVPLERFPDTYNGHPLGLAALASHKQYMSLYLNTVYGDPQLAEWFRDRYAKSGKRLNMGKSCLRFRSLEDVPLDVIGETIAKVPLDRYVEHYRAARGSSRQTGPQRAPDGMRLALMTEPQQGLTDEILAAPPPRKRAWRPSSAPTITPASRSGRRADHRRLGHPGRTGARHEPDLHRLARLAHDVPPARRLRQAGGHR